MSQKPTYEEMGQNIKVIDVGTEKQKWIGRVRLLFILAMAWTLLGCVPKINITIVDHFSIKSSTQSGNIDVSTHGERLLSDLYILMKANEGVKVPICQASKEPKQCIKNESSGDRRKPAKG